MISLDCAPDVDDSAVLVMTRRFGELACVCEQVARVLTATVTNVDFILWVFL